MRLATFNLLHGRGLSDGEVDRDRFVAAIASLDADVLGIQEVDRDQPRSHRLDLTAEAAGALNAPYHRFVATLIGTPGVAYEAVTDDIDRPGERSAGNGLISRWPVREWHTCRLRPSAVPAPGLRMGQAGGWPRLAVIRDEPRAAIAAVIDTPAGPATFASAHLSFIPGRAVRHLVTVLRWLRTLPAPAYLMGDLNLPSSVVGAIGRRLGWHSVGAGATYPSPRPVLQLDHVLSTVRASARTSVPALPISDHRPLVVDFD